MSGLETDAVDEVAENAVTVDTIAQFTILIMVNQVVESNPEYVTTTGGFFRDDDFVPCRKATDDHASPSTCQFLACQVVIPKEEARETSD